MYRPRALALWTASLGLLSVAAVAAGQQASFSTPGALPSGQVGLSADFAKLVSDVFIGRNVVGPYVLSWKGIDSQTVVVTRDGQQLARDVDYRVDCAAGTLVFTAPLQTRQIARVDYVATAGSARPNAVAPLSNPLEFSLFNQGQGALTMQALIKPEASPGTQGSSSLGLMMLGFTGNARLADQSTLTSRFFLDAHGGSVADRSGMQLAEKTKASFGQFNVGFVRAGAGYQAATETGITAGRQVLDAGATLNPIMGIQAAATYQRATELPVSGKGATVTTLAERLNGKLGAATRLQASHTETTTEPGAGGAAIRTVDRLQVDQQLGKTTQATALVERTASDSEDSHAVTQTNKLSVRAQPSDNVTIQGSYLNKLLAGGPQDTATLRVDADPTKRIKLSAQMDESYTATGATHSRTASLQYQPMAAMALNGSMQIQAQAGKELYAGGMGATVRPSRYLDVAGNVRLRQGFVDGVPDPNALDTYDVKVAVRMPGKWLSLTGGYTDNPEDDRGTAARARARSVGLQSTLGRVDLSGGYTLKSDVVGMRTDSTLDVKVGWRVGGGTQLISGYKQTQSLEASLLSTDTYSLSLSQRIGALFDLILSGSLTTNERDGLPQSDPDVKAEAKLGIRF